MSWLEKWRISINPKKTVAILFGDKTPGNLKELRVNSHSGLILGNNLRL